MNVQTRSILVGSLLGDGWLERQGAATAIYRLKTADKTLPYLTWMRSKLRELQPSELKPIQRYTQHYFYTQSRSDLGELRKLFYPNGVKKVPRNIADLLQDPLGLAVWYQDDGTLDQRSGQHWNAMIATYCFSLEDCLRLVHVLKKNFKVEASATRCSMRGKLYYRLYVRSVSMGRFIELVRPFIHPVFAYKIAPRERASGRPAAAVIQRPRAFSGIIGRKASANGYESRA